MKLMYIVNNTGALREDAEMHPFFLDGSRAGGATRILLVDRIRRRFFLLFATDSEKMPILKLSDN